MKELVVALVCICLLASCEGNPIVIEKVVIRTEEVEDKSSSTYTEEVKDAVKEVVVEGQQSEGRQVGWQTPQKQVNKSPKEASGKQVLLMETNRFRISINELGNNKFRYSAWYLEKSMSDTPDLVLNGGMYHVDADSGNRLYIFENGTYRYTCYERVKGEAGRLVVLRKGKILIDQPAKVIKK